MLTLRNLPYYLQLMRVEKPIGSLLLMWPTLWGIWVASSGKPSLKVFLIFMLGVFFMRSAGCVINDIADRNFDKHVSRTKERPLTSGKVTLKEAITLLTLLIAVSFCLALFLKWETLLLAIPALILALSYPFMKRFHSLPQAHLGLAFAFGIPMAFMEVKGELFPATALLLMAANVCWALVFDTEYAMSDREDDKKIDVRSSALLFEKLLGKRDYYLIIALQFGVLFFLAATYSILGCSLYGILSLLVVAGLFAYQINMIKNHDPKRCFEAFLHNNWVGFTVFVGFFLHFFA